MSTIELNGKIQSLREWEELQAQAAQMVETIKDEIKRHMDSVGTEELTVGVHILRWTTITTNRLDTGALKKELPELAAHYTKAVTTRRFTVSD